MSTKPTNPKDRMGIAKMPISVIPGPLLGELGVALFEGARKYGRHNWRVAEALASVYYDAAGRHLLAWFEGEDIDPDSGLNHITKAIATLTVLRDAMIQDKWIDDRPPPSPKGWMAKLNERAANIIKKYPDCVEPWTATRVAHQTADTVASKKRFCQDCGKLLDDYEIETCKLHTCCAVGCNARVHTSDTLCSVHDMRQCNTAHCVSIVSGKDFCDAHKCVNCDKEKYSSYVYCEEHYSKYNTSRAATANCIGLACSNKVMHVGDFCKPCQQPF
jgi:hypothetical protein